MLSVIIKGQKAYGKDHSITDTFAYFKYKLEKQYSVEQVVYALDKYTDIKNDIPAPSDIKNILNPKEPEISATEFNHAHKQWAAKGFPEFCDYKDIVKKYEAQKEQGRDEFKIENKEILALAGNAMKRII